MTCPREYCIFLLKSRNTVQQSDTFFWVISVVILPRCVQSPVVVVTKVHCGNPTLILYYVMQLEFSH